MQTNDHFIKDLDRRTFLMTALVAPALAAALAGDEDLALSDVAFTLAGRRLHEVRMAAVVTVLNDPALLRWNIDKRYLDDLARVGGPVRPSRSR